MENQLNQRQSFPCPLAVQPTHKGKLSTLATTPHLHPAPPTILRIPKQLFRILDTERTLLRGFPLRCPRVDTKWPPVRHWTFRPTSFLTCTRFCCTVSSTRPPKSWRGSV